MIIHKDCVPIKKKPMIRKKHIQINVIYEMIEETHFYLISRLFMTFSTEIPGNTNNVEFFLFISV